MDNRYRRLRYSIQSAASRDSVGRSPGDRAPPRFPPEPPPLARANPEGRAAAAQEGSASLWWARASGSLDYKVARRLEDESDLWPVQGVRPRSPIAPTDQSCPSVCRHFVLGVSSLASPPRSLSIGQHDTGAGAGRRNASCIEVGDPGAGASEIPGADRQRSNGQSGTVATKRQRPISFAPPAGSRHRRRTVGDIGALHRHCHPPNASGRASSGTGARKLALRTGGRGHRAAAADGPQSDGAGRCETRLDGTRDANGQSWTGG